MSRLSDIVTGTIHELSRKGTGILHIGKIPVYVAGTAPGDTITAMVIKTSKHFAIGKLLTIVSPSPFRRPSPCPASPRCGGCGLIHLDPSYQRQQKIQWLRDLLDTQGLTCEISDMVIGHELGYRHRINLSKTTHTSLPYGMNRWHSQYIEPLSHCPIAVPSINDAWDQWSEWGESRHLSTLTISANGSGQTAVAGNDSDGRRYDSGDTILTDTLNGIRYSWTSDSFFQSNIPLAAQLVKTVASLLSPGRLETGVDVFCGVGLFGLYMATMCHAIVGIESNPAAVDMARFNADANGIDNFEVRCQEAEPFFKSGVPMDFGVVDPPRTGLGPALCDQICQSGIGRWVYVSCNPITLATDLARLSSHYSISTIIPFEMFPNTVHSEVVVSLTR
ncbi:class I SAM-dependent RNA methyltransferase [bacterium]|nr:class I SAM-dependent RNA methyltransferase [bacterium]